MPSPILLTKIIRLKEIFGLGISKKQAKKNLVSLFEVLKSNSFMERQMLRREVANPAVI